MVSKSLVLFIWAQLFQILLPDMFSLHILVTICGHILWKAKEGGFFVLIRGIRLFAGCHSIRSLKTLWISTFTISLKSRYSIRSRLDTFKGMFLSPLNRKMQNENQNQLEIISVASEQSCEEVHCCNGWLLERWSEMLGWNIISWGSVLSHSLVSVRWENGLC